MKEEKYKCINDFEIDEYMNDQQTGSKLKIPIDSIWYKDYERKMVIGGEIRLTDSRGGWLEINKETFKRYFIKAY